MQYKFGAPDKYGDFPYLYQNQYTKEQFRDLLMERLPESYDMQIVDPVESDILTYCVNQGIDAHLEAATMTRESAIEDRKVGDRVVQRHHALGFDKTGMICLIRRLEEYDPMKHHPEVDEDDDIDLRDGQTYYDALYEAAEQLRSVILETLQIEAKDI